MISDIDVFGSRSYLWNSCQFQRARVVLKSFAVNLGNKVLSDYPTILGLFQDADHWDNVSESVGECAVLCLSRAKAYHGHETRLLHDGTTSEHDKDS